MQRIYLSDTDTTEVISTTGARYVIEERGGILHLRFVEKTPHNLDRKVDHVEGVIEHHKIELVQIITDDPNRQNTIRWVCDVCAAGNEWARGDASDGTIIERVVEEHKRMVVRMGHQRLKGQATFAIATPASGIVSEGQV